MCTYQSRSERGGRLAKGLTPHADQVIGFSCVLLPGQLTHSSMHAAGQRQKLLSCGTSEKHRIRTWSVLYTCLHFVVKNQIKAKLQIAHLFKSTSFI